MIMSVRCAQRVRCNYYFPMFDFQFLFAMAQISSNKGGLSSQGSILGGTPIVNIIYCIYS